jgi:hypothetical protein
MAIEPGERFGLLTVRCEHPEGLMVGVKKHRAYKCACDCGGEAVASIYDLRYGRRVSCGCRRRRRNAANGGTKRLATGFTAGTYYGVLKQGADRRDLDVEISREDYDAIVTQPCACCGSTVRVGVDRVDNARGYERDNVQALCWDCNRAKGAEVQGDFYEWVARVFQHRLVRRAEGVVSLPSLSGSG